MGRTGVEPAAIEVESDLGACPQPSCSKLNCVYQVLFLVYMKRDDYGVVYRMVNVETNRKIDWLVEAGVANVSEQPLSEVLLKELLALPPAEVGAVGVWTLYRRESLVTTGGVTAGAIAHSN